MKNFKPSEFSCNCGCGGGFGDMDNAFLSMLDDARGLAEVPFKLTSAYRCEDHNRNVGGVPDSAHTTGHAVDILARGGFEKWRTIRGLMKAGFTRIGVAGTFIHADNDPSKPAHVIWTY